MRLRTLVFVCLLAGCERKAAPTPLSSAARAPDAGTALPGRGAGMDSGAPPTAKRALDDATIHVPKPLEAGKKVPLVVLVHGFGASSRSIVEHSAWRAFADEKRIAWVAPDGPRDTTGRRFWNASVSCCDFDERGADHVAAFRGLVERAIERHPVDPKRVYVVGYSNGGFMAHRIACDLAGIVAGVVSVAGAGPGLKTDPACNPSAAVRVLQVHGDADDIVRFAGGPLFGDSRYPSHVSVERTMSDWAVRLECASRPTPAGTLDLETKLPGAETKVSRFENCKLGALELWTVERGDHYVGMTSQAFEAMWKFLSE